MDIIEKLTSCVVPFVNREKWIHKTMVQAAKEISRLRDALQEIASWHGGCGVDWPQEMARKALDANRPGSPDSGGQVQPERTDYMKDYETRTLAAVPSTALLDLKWSSK